MAQGGERRMLFDLRGRRKNAIRVIYAVLAVLMGASLFLVVGGFNLAEIVGTGGGSGDAEEVFDEQAERIEGRLARNPNDAGMLLALTRARINAGNAQIEVGGAPAALPTGAREDYELAREAWERYVEQAGKDANPGAAQLVATTFFTVAERGSTSFADLEESIDTAVSAQRIAAEQQPNVNSLSTLAIYEYFDGDFAAGDKAKDEAAKLAVSKEEVKALEGQLAQFRQQAKRLAKQRQQFAKQEQRSGGEQFENPFGPFGSGTTPGG
jgi:hypothetical protein